jgi:hypothetical protein
MSTAKPPVIDKKFSPTPEESQKLIKKTLTGIHTYDAVVTFCVSP